MTSFSNYSSFGAAVGYSFAVASGDGRGIVVCRTTYLTSQKVYSFIMVVTLCYY